MLAFRKLNRESLTRHQTGGRFYYTFYYFKYRSMNYIKTTGNN